MKIRAVIKAQEMETSTLAMVVDYLPTDEIIITYSLLIIDCNPFIDATLEGKQFYSSMPIVEEEQGCAYLEVIGNAYKKDKLLDVYFMED